MMKYSTKAFVSIKANLDVESEAFLASKRVLPKLPWNKLCQFIPNSLPQVMW